MILVPYVVRPAAHGLGVFAQVPVRRGQAVYRRHPGFSLCLDDESLSSLHPAVRAKVESYAYRGKGEHRREGMSYYDADDSRFLNHSANPNIVPVGDGDEYRASRDIAVEEEFTCDYREFSEPGDRLLEFLASSPA